MSVHYLKIKVTSLAAEIKLIKREERIVKPTKAFRKKVANQLKSNELTVAQRERVERKLEKLRNAATAGTERNKTFWGLRHHREDLSVKSREAQLAYAFLRGRPYKLVERDAKSEPDWTAVYSNVVRFGTTPAEKDSDSFKAWKTAA